MTDSPDEFLSYATSAQLPQYPFHSDNSSFGPDRNQHRRFRHIIPGNAARERTRVKTLRGAFLELQRTLPAVPPDTKLSKLDVLVLATTYIAHLMRTLNEDVDENQLFAAHGIMHPVKKWPMRSRLYAGILSSTYPLFDQKPDNTSRQLQWIQHESHQATSPVPWRRETHVKPYDLDCPHYFDTYNGVYSTSED